MNERIRKITEVVLRGEARFQSTKVEHDRCDLLLEPVEMSAKRISEYILGQRPQVTEQSALTGWIHFGDAEAEDDIFQRSKHKAFQTMCKHFYMKPLDNLVTFEWQHSAGNFKHVIDVGLDGLKAEIAQSRQRHSEKDELLFLDGLDRICDAIIGWANKCSDAADELARSAQSEEARLRLGKLAKTLRKVPKHPAKTFYEAVECVYLCFSFLPDSFGLLDRYLYRFYEQDLANGTLTREEAGAYLQELFLMPQAYTDIRSSNFYRGGQSHFCIGGYLPDGTDGFNDLSRLIVESLMDLPTFIPQVSIRWTKKTPHEVLRFMLDCERNDPHKRIAFVNDEPRLKGLMEIAGFPYELAVNYTMVGCNEPVMTGGRIEGGSQQNLLRSMANTFHQRGDDIRHAATFEDFYALYEQELFSDLREIIRLDKAFNLALARDCNLISCLFLDGCIETAKSATQGGETLGTATMDLIGVVSVIDSLAVVKQFVYDEQRCSMEELVSAVQSDWEGHEELRTQILNTGKYFGNDDESTNALAQRLTDSIHRCLERERNCFGRRFVVGNLIGYHPHNKWFGNLTAATPDGRHAGDMMQFGIGQTDGKDREGLTALLNSIAQCDPHCLMVGPSVTNVLLDEKLIRDDGYFEKLVYMIENYFHKGGTHIQLNYVSKDDLVNAKANPDKYKSLRVRVSGFSDFFVNLNDDLQNEIITRTEYTEG